MQTEVTWNSIVCGFYNKYFLSDHEWSLEQINDMKISSRNRSSSFSIMTYRTESVENMNIHMVSAMACSGHTIMETVC